MQRPRAASSICGRPISPRSLMMDCVVSIIISIFSEFVGRFRLGSSASKMSARAETCAGITIFGSVMTKFSGNCPFVSLTNVVKKRSSVRILRLYNSSEKVLMRMPINGGRVPASKPLATSFAPKRCVRLPRRRGACRSRLQNQCGNLRSLHD